MRDAPGTRGRSNPHPTPTPNPNPSPDPTPTPTPTPTQAHAEQLVAEGRPEALLPEMHYGFVPITAARCGYIYMHMSVYACICRFRSPPRGTHTYIYVCVRVCRHIYVPITAARCGLLALKPLTRSLTLTHTLTLTRTLFFI